MRKIPSQFTVPAALLILCAAARADTIFSDSTFNAGNYQSSILLDTTFGATGHFNTSQSVNGGNLGSFLDTQFSFTFTAGQGVQVVWVGHLLNTGTYTPLTQGGIADIGFTLDSKLISESGGTPGVNTGILLRQNNQFYAYQTQHLFPPDGWQSFSQAATPGASAALQFNGVGFTGHPDFSASGASITFGFYELSGAGVGSTTTISLDVGADNWSVDIQSVPEAGTWAVGTLAATLLAFQLIRGAAFSRRNGFTKGGPSQSDIPIG